MTIRCKFRCVEAGKVVGWDSVPFHFKFRFMAVTGGSPDNEEFFAATPSGSIELHTVRQEFFEPGRDYFLDFTPAEDWPHAGPGG